MTAHPIMKTQHRLQYVDITETIYYHLIVAVYYQERNASPNIAYVLFAPLKVKYMSFQLRY